MEPSMPHAGALEVAAVWLGSDSRRHRLASRRKAPPVCAATLRSTKTATVWPDASGRHETSSVAAYGSKAPLRFDAPRQEPTVTGVPGDVAGQSAATYRTRLPE